MEWLQGCEGQMGVRQNRLQSHHDHSPRRDCEVLPRTHSLNTVYVLSRQGNPVLQIGKYRYRKWTGNKELKARWICNRNNNGCPAKVVTLHGVVVNLQGEHNH